MTEDEIKKLVSEFQSVKTDKNDEIDSLNDQLTNLVDNIYPAAMKTLTASSETLEKTKKEYEDQAILLSNSKYYKQTEKYKVEFLWAKIGDYAKENDVTVDLKFRNSVASGLYDLDIETVGKYSDVADFIYDIENDSKLGFKIEDFSMQSASISTDSTGRTTASGVKGIFTCKELRIEMKALDGGSSKSTTDTTNNSSENTTNENSTSNNTTSETNTTNTTNSTTNTTNTVKTEEVELVNNTNEVN